MKRRDETGDDHERSRSSRNRERAAHARPTGWVGWVYFAGAMLVLVGTFNLIEGLVALFNDQYYVPTPA